MRVSPAPDVVTRIFMLFRGVRSDDVGLWAQAVARATEEDGATFWTKVVGVDAVRASDHTLFRVLEWGGMKVECVGVRMMGTCLFFVSFGLCVGHVVHTLAFELLRPTAGPNKELKSLGSLGTTFPSSSVEKLRARFKKLLEAKTPIMSTHPRLRRYITMLYTSLISIGGPLRFP